mmetsp:Transcript_4503/g.12973  ORF Transcript_4503/g.12973 Transcript_4503/m.12973 type:complete len:234 (+) Transcript_4503:360-1061(+)
MTPPGARCRRTYSKLLCHHLSTRNFLLAHGHGATRGLSLTLNPPLASRSSSTLPRTPSSPTLFSPKLTLCPICTAGASSRSSSPCKVAVLTGALQHAICKRFTSGRTGAWGRSSTSSRRAQSASTRALGETTKATMTSTTCTDRSHSTFGLGRRSRRRLCLKRFAGSPVRQPMTKRTCSPTRKAVRRNPMTTLTRPTPMWLRRNPALKLSKNLAAKRCSASTTSCSAKVRKMV